MNRIFASLLCTSAGVLATGKTFFVPRDAMFQEYMWSALRAAHRHDLGKGEFYGDVGAQMGWQQQHDHARLARYFFNPNGCLAIGPASDSTVNIRNIDLGLSHDARGTLGIEPSYNIFLATFDGFLGFDEFVHGLWLSLRLPCQHVHWQTNIRSCVENPGNDAVYTANGTVGILNLHDETRYIVYGSSPNPVPVAYTHAGALQASLEGEHSFGDAPILQAGKITTYRQRASGLAGIDVHVGYDFVRKQRLLIGAALGIVGPAANRPAKDECDQFIFIGTPVIGPLHAWQFAGQLLGRINLINKDEGLKLDLWADAQISGLTRTRSTRLLGLQAGNTTCFNQYLLLKKYAVTNTGAQYLGLERAANLLKADLRTRCNWQSQVTLMFNWYNRGFSGSLGYNFFARGRERCFSYRTCSNDWQLYKYTVAGDAPILGSAVGRWVNGGFYDPANTTIHTLGTLVPASQQDAGAGPQPNLADAGPVRSAALTREMIASDVALHPRYLSHTLFFAGAYEWTNSDWRPQLGVIGMYEHGANDASVHTWGIFVSGAIGF